MILSSCILCKLVRALHPARHLLSLLFLLFHLVVICTHHGDNHQAQKGALLKKIINILLSGAIPNLGIPCELEHWVLLPQARRNPSIKEGHPQRDCSNLISWMVKCGKKFGSRGLKIFKLNYFGFRFCPQRGFNSHRPWPRATVPPSWLKNDTHKFSAL